VKSEMDLHQYGEFARMPDDGKPFHLACEGCNTVYDLRFKNDGDTTHMAVDINPDETRQLADARASRHFMHDTGPASGRSAPHRGDSSMPVARKRFTVADAPDILPDGAVLHVPAQEMRDSARRFGGTGPLVINSGMRLDRFYFPDGTPKNSGDEPEPRRRRKTYGREGGRFEESDHRPHFADADRSASERARAERMALDAQAWMSPEQRAQNVSDAQRATADAPPAGVDARAWARELTRRETQDAWKTAPLGTGVLTQAMESLPPGRFPMSAGVGTICDLNGEQGTLQPDGSGYLVCKVTRRVGPTRVEPTNRGATGDRAAVDRAWEELQEATRSAWQRG
jgi:hypothetical protein